MSFRRLSRLFVLLVLCGLFPMVALAGYKDNPPPQPGFSHSLIPNVDDSGHGLRLSGLQIGRSSPTIAEIDGNTGNGKEVAVGGIDGKLYVYHKDGSKAWEVQVAAACASSHPDGMINTAPAVGVLFGDGVPYVVIGYGTSQTSASCNRGGVAAYNGQNGNLKWRYELQNPSEGNHGMRSSPALADVDGDGKLEVGFGTLERDVVMLNSDGSKRWRFHNADTVISSPSFADVDGDNLPDMIIGSDISANLQINPPTADGGYVTAFRGTDSTILWRRFFDQTIYSSPVIVDLDGNRSLEVVIGSGCYFDPAKKGHWVKILNLKDGSDVRTLNADGCINSAPAVADLNGNGKFDIVAMVDGTATGKATMHAWEYDNPTPKWKTAPGAALSGANEPTLVNDERSPVIADIDGNGSLEVLGVNYDEVVVYNGATGQQLTCNNCKNSTTSLFAWYPLKSTPAVGDIDGDGDLEVVVGGSHLNDNKRGFLYAWTNMKNMLGSPAGSGQPYAAPWPMFRGSPTHVGVMSSPALRPGISSLVTLVKQSGDSKSLTVPISDAAGGTIAWTATKDKSWLSITPQGTTPGTLTITVDPSGKSAGFDETATVTVSSASGSPTISVRLLVVAELHETYLPLGLR